MSTRNSKIPKVSVPKNNSSVPSMTTIHSAAGGSSLIPQPARKSLSSKVSSKFKHASNAAKSSLESVSKSNKQATDLRNDAVNSALRRHSLMSHRAPHTTKVSKCSENSSCQGLLSGVADVVKSSDETSNTAALSHVHFDNAGLNRINVQVQGIKPSGLRMPSPSLRFFSETKAPTSNTLSQVNSKVPNLLESTISTSRKSEVAYRNHDFKCTQLSHEAPNVDTMGKVGLCSQTTEKCTTSLIVAPKVHSDVIQKKCDQQAIDIKTLLGDKTSESTKDEQSRYDFLDTFEIQYEGQVSISSKVEEKDRKDNKSVCSNIEFEEPSCKDAILLQENRTTGRSMLVESHKSCLKAELIKPCEANAEVQSQQLEVEVNSTAMNNDATLEPQTNSISHYDNLILAPDSNTSSRIVDDNRTSDNDLDQTNSQRSTQEQFSERNLLANDKSAIKVVEEGSAVSVCTDNVMAESNCSGVTGICNASCSVAGDSEFELVDDEQDEVLYYCKSPTMNLSESSEVQDREIENHDMQQITSTNSTSYDTKDSCAVNVELAEMSSHCASTLPEMLNKVPVKRDHLANSDQGEGQSQSSICGISGNYASVLGASVASNQDTEISEDSDAEADKQQDLNKKLLAKEMTLQKNEAYLNHSTVSQDSSYRIGQSNNHTEDVQDQIDLLSSLPNNGNEITPKITHLEFQSSGLRCEDQLVVAVANSDPEEYQCPVNNDEMSPKEVLMRKNFDECILSDEQGCNDCNLSPREARLNVSEYVENRTDERTCSSEVIDNEDAATKQRTENEKSTRPPPNVVPFSDEWLAVIESAGEEILTLKTGPVKHSPPDKSTLEPSPWSPVKRVIGPFDCTKYTNAQPDSIN
ncbi:uncharacterized protein LOC110701607 [Chenopodium quinoa]|uniref:Uncharacterized protein n=1 Tax=Chenopodium quinoa TaxID=63459 RepID=A0A803L3Q6_CHEQI|nr:uncharacterized protein LOC110701607 [Chenopodium quinoa]XP_021734932.1 uncharacterized protein LOC110701607 [Chenopodium quinoa]XP_021734933.1 uncharacterized protein LOC110701607 [Chenopodium quinoa]